jgi:hypothetical protein
MISKWRVFQPGRLWSNDEKPEQLGAEFGRISMAWCFATIVASALSLSVATRARAQLSNDLVLNDIVA